MDRSNLITLIKTSYAYDAIGQAVPVETRRTVYCNLRSVSRGEWSAAGQLGLKPELMATLFAPDYQGEGIVEISISGISEALYLTDEALQQLYGYNAGLLRAGADEDPAGPGTALRYGVYRTYWGANETVELYLERKAGPTNG